jgi:tetratricopeptide (TPR) repeat protein
MGAFVLGLWLTLACGVSVAAELEFEEHLQRAASARARGDWQSAASQFAQAINHSDLPRDGATRSEVNMEYGRSMGVLCQYAEAEKYLLRAKDIAEQSGAPRFPVLQELLAVSVAQKKYDVAITYFAQLQPLIEGESRVKTSPLQVANAYQRIADAFAATGKSSEAEARRAEAARVREFAPKKAPAGTITPYGAQCPKG